MNPKKKKKHISLLWNELYSWMTQGGIGHRNLYWWNWTVKQKLCILLKLSLSPQLQYMTLACRCHTWAEGSESPCVSEPRKQVLSCQDRCLMNGFCVSKRCELLSMWEYVFHTLCLSQACVLRYLQRPTGLVSVVPLQIALSWPQQNPRPSCPKDRMRE